MRARDLGRLLRISLLPSAQADVAAGIVFAGLGRWPDGAGPWWLLASSACVYHGAMALNDWRDREHDARTRPGRPIPSGAVAPTTALALGLALLLGGPLLALQHGREAALWSAGLAALAATYDLVGRGAFLGPLLLAACRAGNLGLGLFLGAGALGAGPPVQVLLVPIALYALYVLRVSQLGRLEDGEDSERGGAPQAPQALGVRARGLVLSAAILLALVPALPPLDLRFHPLAARGVAALIAWPAALGLALAAAGREPWPREQVERAMGLALRRLSIFAAALAALAWRAPAPDALVVAAAILAGFGLSVLLRRAFPPS